MREKRVRNTSSRRETVRAKNDRYRIEFCGMRHLMSQSLLVCAREAVVAGSKDAKMESQIHEDKFIEVLASAAALLSSSTSSST